MRNVENTLWLFCSTTNYGRDWILLQKSYYAYPVDTVFFCKHIKNNCFWYYAVTKYFWQPLVFFQRKLSRNWRSLNKSENFRKRMKTFTCRGFVRANGSSDETMKQLKHQIKLWNSWKLLQFVNIPIYIWKLFFLVFMIIAYHVFLDFRTKIYFHLKI